MTYLTIQVLPVVMQLLPLKEDIEENVTVFTCVSKLYSEKIPEVTYLTFNVQKA